jgi:dynein heavy chain
LPFFVHLFNFAIDEAEKSDELEVRIGYLNKEFLSSLYRNICRSLFEVDKPIFSMLLTFKLLDMKGELNATDLRFLLTGGVALGAEYPECPATWMTNLAWGEMCRACELKSLKGFDKHFTKHAN